MPPPASWALACPSVPTSTLSAKICHLNLHVRSRTFYYPHGGLIHPHIAPHPYPGPAQAPLQAPCFCPLPTVPHAATRGRVLTPESLSSSAQSPAGITRLSPHPTPSSRRGRGRGRRPCTTWPLLLLSALPLSSSLTSLSCPSLNSSNTPEHSRQPVDQWFPPEGQAPTLSDRAPQRQGQ